MARFLEKINDPKMQKKESIRYKRYSIDEAEPLF